MIGLLLAASLTFTATATGVEKGAPVEFLFVGPGSDRDYEALFILDESVGSFCRRLEQAGLPRGAAVDSANCRLWPVGCPVSLKPAVTNFVAGTLPDGLEPSAPVYTGGTRLKDGTVSAETNSPFAAFSLYALAQSPIAYENIYPQGEIYGAFTARSTIPKGERVSFRIDWDAATMPRHLHLTAHPGKGRELLRTLQAESEKGVLDVLVGFDDSMTVREAKSVAQALATVDSPRVKLNGVTNVFFRSFLPLVKWTDRQERTTQPFELTVGEPDKLVFIEEDWNVEGIDPKLTPREISFAEAVQHPKTDACFVYMSGETTIGRLVKSMAKLEKANVRTWYYFLDNNPSSHNADCAKKESK